MGGYGDERGGIDGNNGGQYRQQALPEWADAEVPQGGTALPGFFDGSGNFTTDSGSLLDGGLEDSLGLGGGARRDPIAEGRAAFLSQSGEQDAFGSSGDQLHRILLQLRVVFRVCILCGLAVSCSRIANSEHFSYRVMVLNAPA